MSEICLDFQIKLLITYWPIFETDKIIKEWARVLKMEGIIEFRVPNLADICKRYIDGKHDAKHTSWLLYGAQDYQGNFHYVAFDRKWLKTILESLGFREIHFEEEGNNFVAKFKKLIGGI